jgi:hypothetical protein
VSAPSRARRWLPALAVLAAFLIQAAPAFADFDFEYADAGTIDGAGQAVTQAGAHPFGIKTVAHFTLTAPNKPTEKLKDVTTLLPAGLVGDPTAIPQCPPEIFAELWGHCPSGSQIGLIANDASTAGSDGKGGTFGVYNLAPQDGAAAQFGFKVVGIPVMLTARVRPGDYRVVVTAKNLPAAGPTSFADVLLWGTPADPRFDTFRTVDPTSSCPGGMIDPPVAAGCFPATSAEVAPKPFLSMPQDCSGGPTTTTLSINSWEDQEDVKTASIVSHNGAIPPIPIGPTGCDLVPFGPKISALPSTNLADSPTGMEINVNLPQSEDPDGLATAYLKKAVVELPKGITVNPSSAAGLGACSPGQIGLITAVGNPAARFNGDPVGCPDSSRIGTVRVDTPVVDHPLPGAIYLAEQNNNPFNSLLALYLVIDDPQTGVRVKLAGKAEPNASTGQLKATFDENAQLPFEDLEVSLFEGPRAPLKTAINCGTFTTTSEMTPWTAPEGARAFPKDSFQIQRGANDGACVSSESQAPNSPNLSAGTIDPTAGAYSPFVLRVTRADGTQPLKRIEATLPKGLLGKLAGIPYCSDQALASAAGKSGKAEQSSSSCPSASQIGSVNVGAGAGSLPLYVDGKAYLTGPYKGAPLSMAIVTPAVAGPFDLGTVVVRTRLEVNPETTQIKAISDEIPTILQGIPLDVRSIAVNLDKPSFTLNPTSCAKTQVFASATSVFDQSAALSSPFQVGGCAALGFKPKLALRLSGAPTRRGGYPALRATLTMPQGGANIARAQVTLPKTELLAQHHIRTICTRVQHAAKACPAGSIYGRARAWSPLIEKPLEGPVYLRSSNNKLPDLVASLDGQIHVDLVGRIDSVNARIRNTFDIVPDAPVSKFVLTMRGGKKSLLVNTTELCRAKPRASVMFDGQNGKISDSTPLVKVAGCKKKKKAKRR